MYTIYFDGDNIITGDIKIVEVIDQNANANLGRLSVVGSGPPVPVSISVSRSGFGYVQYRNVTNNLAWIGVPFMNDGDHIHVL